MTASQRLAELKITLPTPPKPVASYIPGVRVGNLVMCSGQLPFVDGKLTATGKVGGEVTLEAAQAAARQAGLNAIAQLQAAVGDLEKVRLVRVEGYVHCGEGFREHPKVLDGASELFLAVFGDKGKHVRIALGIKDMPLNAPVQIAVWAELG